MNCFCCCHGGAAPVAPARPHIEVARAPQSQPVAARRTLLKRFTDLPAAALAEIIDSLPLTIEVCTAAGDVFSNHHDRNSGALAFSVRLTNGSDLSCMQSSETAALFGVDIAAFPGRQTEPQQQTVLSSDPAHLDAPRPVSETTGDVVSVPPRTPLRFDSFVASLEVIPVQAWALEIADAEVVSVTVNSRFASFRGVSTGPQPRSSWREGVFTDDIASSHDAWIQALSTGSTYTNNSRIQRASDGAFVWLREEGCPLRDASGALVAYVCVA